MDSRESSPSDGRHEQEWFQIILVAKKRTDIAQNWQRAVSASLLRATGATLFAREKN